MKKINTGIIATSETAQFLRGQVVQTGMASQTVHVLENTERPSRQFVESNPEVIIVEILNTAVGVRTLQALQSALPNARLMVVSRITDPQLIMEVMQSGAREFLPHPVSQANIVQAFNRYLAEKERATSSRKRGKLYSIITAKPGSGATTLAINLAGVIAARSKRRIALMDMDRPVGDVAAYLNIKPNFTISDAFAAGSRLDSVLLESYMQSASGFHLLAGIGEHASNESLPTERLAQLLEVARDTYDCTVMDLPAHLSDEEIRLVAGSSEAMLVVLTPNLPAVWRTERLLSHLNKLDAAEGVRIVLNRVTRSDEIADSDIARLLKQEVHCRLPNDYKGCMDAVNSGCLLDQSSSKQLVRSVQALASDLLGLPDQGRRGLFGMFMKPSSIGGPVNA